MKFTPPNLRSAGSLCALALAGCHLLSSTTRAEEPGVYYGVFVTSSLSSNITPVTNFEGVVGKNVSIINMFLNWKDANTMRSFPTAIANNIHNHGSIPLITWQPTQGAFPDSMFSCAKITSGYYDDYIRQWATAAAAWKHPFFLRFAHEMNGNWYPWGFAVNGNQSGDYKAMWRHVRLVFDSVNNGAGVPNATWVWCVNRKFTGSPAFAQFYPGDQYVDWTSLDAYNRGTDGGNTWTEFSDLIADTYSEIAGIAPGKPVMVAENGCDSHGGSKNSWFTNALQTTLPNNYPRIKAWVYFDLDKDYDNSVVSGGPGCAGFQSGIALAYYGSNQYGGLPDSAWVAPLTPDRQATDTMGPFVSVVKPGNSAASVGSSVHIVINTSDKSGINKVEIYIDGTLKQTENLAPYEYYWTVPSAGDHLITAKSYDTKGNTTASSIYLTGQ